LIEAQKVKNMKCEYCEKEHDGSYGSGRFCGFVCKQRFALASRLNTGTQEFRDKLLLNLKIANQANKTPEVIEKQRATRKKNARKTRLERLGQYKSKDQTRLALIEARGEKCEVCGISSWQQKSIVFQLHHIDGNSSNNSLKNIQLLCPNCHSQTSNYGTKNAFGKNVEDSVLIDAILDEKNTSIKMVLRCVGLTDRGGNYNRVYKLCVLHKINKFAV
jgi:5-methylcytosine-specific restriction endonuclease McrA